MVKKILPFAFCALASFSNLDAQTFDRQPVNIILDTDIGSSTDDLFTMDLLYKYMDEGRANLLGIMVDRPGDVNAEIVDAFNTFYGYPNIPIGMVRCGVENTMVFIDYSFVAKSFDRTVKDVSKLPDAVKLYRKILSAQPDNSVVVLSIGFVTNLAQLLQSGPDEYSNLNGKDLVAKKVKSMYLQGGAFYATDESDYNIPCDKESGKIVVENWPTPIILSPMEVGEQVDYAPDAVVADLSKYKKHPLKAIYENNFTDFAQRMWDPNTVINAVEGNDFYTISMPCKLSLRDDGFVEYRYDKNGNSYYQLANRQQALAIYALIREMVSRPVANK